MALGPSTLPYRQSVYCFLIGAFPLSFFPSTFLTTGGFLVADIILLIGISLVFYRSSLISSTRELISSRFFAASLAVGLILFFLGFINTRDLFSSLRDFKAFIFFVASFQIAKRLCLKPLSLYFISISSLLLSLLLAVYFPRDADIASFKNHFCLFLIPLVVFAPPGTYFPLRLCGWFIAFIACFISGFRSSFILYFLSMILFLASPFVCEVPRLIRYMRVKLSLLFIHIPLISFVVFLSIYFSDLYQLVSEAAFSRDPRLYNQLFYKTDLLVSGSAGYSDVIRQAYVERLFQDPLAFLIPSGFGASAIVGSVPQLSDLPHSDLRDSVYICIAYQFGIVALLVLSILFIRSLVSMCFRSLSDSSGYCWLYFSLLLALFVHGLFYSFISVPINAAFVGLFLGSLSSFSVSSLIRD
jgi:hypothetical protein